MKLILKKLCQWNASLKHWNIENAHFALGETEYTKFHFPAYLQHKGRKVSFILFLSNKQKLGESLELILIKELSRLESFDNFTVSLVS